MRKISGDVALNQDFNAGGLFSQPVHRLLLVCMCVVAVVPLGMMTLYWRDAAWEDNWREIREKHQLLASNLSSPIQIYVNNQKSMLGLLASSLSTEVGPIVDTAAQSALGVALDNVEGFQSLTYIDRDGRIRGHVQRGGASLPEPQMLADEACYVRVRDTRQPFVSGVKASPFNGKPSIFVGSPVIDGNKQLRGVLLGELRIDLIEGIRQKVQFGTRGHSAIIDQKGKVIAHPNPEWMASMHDMSVLPIVKELQTNQRGVDEFYSPHLKQMMVAGFDTVPGLGWGVLVPQPRSEVEERIHQMMWPTYLWVIFGVSMAIFLACCLTYWITLPVNLLARDARRLLEHELRGRIHEPCFQAPRELRLLGHVLSRLVQGVQESRAEVEALNAELHGRVEQATQELTVANRQLARMASSDYLTSLANRRHFETELVRGGDELAEACVMLIDIDHFKQINDGYGHAAGDLVLVNVASVLGSSVQQDELVARYGGDEFVARLHCDENTAFRRATAICQQIAKTEIVHRGEKLPVTVSIGLCHYSREQGNGEVVPLDAIMHCADVALYRAKREGRNRAAVEAHGEKLEA